MKDQNIKNAIIESVDLRNDDHGCLTVWIHLDYGDSSHQGFGGYALYLPKSFIHHKTESLAGHFIFRLLEIADVNEWEKIKGKSIRVAGEGELFNFKIKGIGHIIKDDWFYPENDFKEYREKEKNK